MNKDEGTTAESARRLRHEIVSAVRGAVSAAALGASLLLLLVFVQSASASSRSVAPDVATRSSLDNGAWQWQNPLPHGNRLIDSAALSDVAALALVHSFKCTLKRGVHTYRVLAVDSAGNSQSVIGVDRLTVT